jgi:ribulose-phosphate 3-epimerase
MTNKHEIIPAIIPSSFEDMREKASLVKELVAWVQIDVIDGIFVPSVSWPYAPEGISAFRDMVSQKQQLPFLDKLNYGIDLMVENPEEEIPKWYSIGARRFIVHIESIKNLDILEQIVMQYRKANVSEVGIALNIETPIALLEPIMSEIDSVQFMGIARIGYQGEKFDERVIDKIKHLRKRHKDVIISVDGGVSLETASLLIGTGATRLVCGSAIFGSDDKEKTIKILASI